MLLPCGRGGEKGMNEEAIGCGRDQKRRVKMVERVFK